MEHTAAKHVTTIFMPKHLILFALSIIFASCQMDSPTGNGGSAAVDQEMENKIKQLELDNAMKDSMINEALGFFNEIKHNLETISARNEEIRVLSTDPELSNEDKNWILEEIKHINFLREENAKKVGYLRSELKKNGLKIQELENMIESLVKEIQWKDEQIGMLQTELDQLDADYTRLFDAYQHAALSLDLLTEEMNTAYYAYGTEEELTNNNVLEKKNGFLGIGKKILLKDQFNEDYFTAIDVTKMKSITIEGTDVHLISAHQPSSYELVEGGTSTVIKIKSPAEFWKVSKYLVVITK